MAKVISVICMLMLASCSQKTEDDKIASELKLDTDNLKFSYAMGLEAGATIKSYGMHVNRTIVLSAIIEGLDGAVSKLSYEELVKAKSAYITKIREERAEIMKAWGEKNKIEGPAFLAENAKKAGVTVTKSGLQYVVIKQGNGSRPKVTDKVTVRYAGTLIDGTEFNPYHKFEQETNFPLDGVIKGWTEGIQLMRVGSIFKFIVPADLAYGDQNRGENIGPNSVLIFRIELLSIE